MIAKLTGEVTDVGVTSVVIDVHGIGYLVYVTKSSGYKIGETVSVFTYLAVRENALDLYGFQVREEKAMFTELIKLPKIGPKTAIQILSQVDLETLKKAVQTEDPTYLSKMSGIGKKSAEKIVAGLKDLLDGDDYLYTEEDRAQNQGDTDVIEALLTLGYSERDAREAVKKIPESVKGTNARIKHALKEVSN
jgi:Holliday junction DNA helicase RuvA